MRYDEASERRLAVHLVEGLGRVMDAARSAGASERAMSSAAAALMTDVLARMRAADRRAAMRRIVAELPSAVDHAVRMIEAEAKGGEPWEGLP